MTISFLPNSSSSPASPPSKNYNPHPPHAHSEAELPRESFSETMGRLVLEQAICQQKENSPSHPGFPDEPPVFAPDAVLALPQSLRSQSAQTESPSFSEQFGYLALSQAIAEQKASEPNRSVFSDGPTVWAPDAVLSPNWHWGDVEAQGIRP